MTDYWAIKAGDYVWLNFGPGEDNRRVCRVQRITGTQIILEPGTEFDRYRRTNGVRVGNPRNGLWISVQATAEDWGHQEEVFRKQDQAKKAEQRRRSAVVRETESLSQFFTRGEGVYSQPGPQHGKTWAVTIPNLTPDQVCKLSKLVDKLWA